jgi:hypothetical protein
LIPHEYEDGLFGEYWRRPHNYLDRAAYSAVPMFANIENIESRLEQLRRDLDSGAWATKNQAITGLDALDLGYRLITARKPKGAAGNRQKIDRPVEVEGQPPNYLYDAFMSYSHRADTERAAALQNALHRFAKPWHRLRALRIFRDRTDSAISGALELDKSFGYIPEVKFRKSAPELLLLLTRRIDPRKSPYIEYVLPLRREGSNWIEGAELHHRRTAVWPQPCEQIEKLETNYAENMLAVMGKPASWPSFLRRYQTKKGRGATRRR